MTFINLFSPFNTIFLNDWAVAIKTLFLFISFHLVQSHEYQKLIETLAPFLSIKPKNKKAAIN